MLMQRERLRQERELLGAGGGAQGVLPSENN